MRQSLFFISFLISSLSISQTISSNSVLNVLDLKTKINKLTINSNANNNIDIYVASTNHLYKIIDSNTDNLKIDIDLVTGPKAQKQQCAFITEQSASTSSTQCIKYICDDDSSQSKLLKLQKSQKYIDNDNRLLLIDAKNQHLIECGTIDYGGCRLRQLSDLQVISTLFFY